MIIDTSYFIYEPLKIPNAVAQPALGTNTPTNIAELEKAINDVEYRLLVNALGSEQYDELVAVTPAQKWLDLLNGKTLDNGQKWEGLRNTRKQSLIAYYVYYSFLINDQVYYSVTGLSRADNANSRIVVPDSKLCKEWNTFVYLYQGFFDGCGQAANLSMYEFLNSFPDLYDTKFFTFYQPQNAWGI